MTEKADISILGCGWLGLPLAERFVQNGKVVNGSTTTSEKLALLQEKGIRPYLINLQEEKTDQQDLKDFLNASVLVINFPPKIRSGLGDSFLAQLHFLLKAMRKSPINRVVFVSSTSVYPDLNRVVTEADSVFTEEQEPENVMLQGERLFQDREDWVTTIVRFGGLVGGTRKAGRFMAGKKNLPNGDAPVNLIHQDDCVNIIERIVEQGKWSQVYNACSDEHPSRKDFYTKAALALALTPPEFEATVETSFKRINSQKLKDDLAYVFLHPDPMQFF